MRALWCALLLVGCQRDLDGDGFSADEDCDDDNAAVFPGNEDVCDGLDNDCSGLADDGADSIPYYRDDDGDGFGVDGVMSYSCFGAPEGYSDEGGDCDDTDPDVSPSSVWYRDGDGDGAGDPTSVLQACEQPEGYVDTPADCNDEDPNIYLDAEEVCDAVDNDCDGGIDEGLAGDAACPALSCKAIADGDDTKADGIYWLDPEADGTAWQAYCDLSTAGGGWTLLAWTGDATYTESTEAGTIYQGVPYPGVSVCGSFDCGRGSAADVVSLTGLLQGASQLAVGVTGEAVETFFSLGSYDEAVQYDYGSLSGFVLDTENALPCDPLNAIEGIPTVIAGDFPDALPNVFVAQSFRVSVAESLNSYVEGVAYQWSPGVPGEACAEEGIPGAWVGTSGANIGPGGEGFVAGSVWVR